ncbi:MAG: AAA family ATPase [Candidatus Nanopelagicales bacterium]|jgi:Mrp family chromosome partitioning ATPase
MNSSSEPAGTRVIAVVDSPTFASINNSGFHIDLQPQLASVSHMWAALKDGSVDARARVLIFSDSQHETDPTELQAVAGAIVTMSVAGATVVLLTKSSQAREVIESAIVQLCTQQGIDPETVNYQVFAHESVEESLATIVPAEIPVTESSSAASPNSRSRPALPPRDQQPTESEPSHDGMPEQADRDLLNQPQRPGQVTITVTSSKGGSGKSTASILLASSIARQSAEAGAPLSVCLIDLDIRDGQVASMIGQFMPTALNIRVQPIWDEERIKRNLVHAPGLGIDTLLAPIRPRTAQSVGPDFYRTIVRSLQRMYDVVVMDTSVQYLDPLISEVALVEADEILFVTNLASTAVQGMARALREITSPIDESGLGIPREKIGIIVNQSLAGVGMEQEQVAAAGLGIPVVGVIPLATKDVLTATNLLRMHELLDHPLLGPAYSQLVDACLPNIARHNGQ